MENHTIKSCDDYGYILSIPNKEVRQALTLYAHPEYGVIDL